MMSSRHTIKLTANFERNLEEVEAFLLEAESSAAFDRLLNELTDTIVPNLERFPKMGRLFFERTAGSVETSNGISRLIAKMDALPESGELREYVTSHYLMLYVATDDSVYLVSVRHHRQLSFDLSGHWQT